jgi:hypothetical protein
MGSFSKNVALLLLGFWLGCAIFLAFVVARGALFNPDVAIGLTPEMISSIIRAILRRTFLITYISIGISVLFLTMACLGEARGAKGPQRALMLCLIILSLNAVNDLWIMNQTNKVQLAMQNTLDTSKKDTLKLEFKKWHKISTSVFGTAVVLGTIAALCLLPSAAAPKGKRSGR